MAYQEAKTLLDSFISEKWNETVINELLNNPEKVTGSEPWLSYEPVIIDDEFMGSSGDQQCWTTDIMLDFTIYVLAGTGIEMATTLSEKLKHLILANRQLDAFTKFADVSGPEFGNGKKQTSRGKWFEATVSVHIEHRYYING